MKRSYRTDPPTTVSKALIAALPAILLLAACGGGGEGGGSDAAGGATETTELRFGLIFAPSVPIVECGANYLTDSEALADVGLEVSVFPAAVLGGENEMVRQVSSGELSATLGTSSIIASDFNIPQLAALEAYYVLDEVEQVFEVYDSEIADELFAPLKEKANLQQVGRPWLYGERHIFGSRPIREPEDLQSLRLRVPETKVSIASAEALGTDPTPTAYAELYLALQQGIVEAAEAPAAVIEAESFDEPADYISLTRHLISASPFIINVDLWEGLTPEQQKALEAEIDEASGRVADCVAEADAAALDAWRESGELEVVEDVNRDAIKEMVREEFSEGYPFSETYREIVDRFAEG
jgi:TRAP-type C4-dicarboxylate transport system substrate-binding protein